MDSVREGDLNQQLDERQLRSLSTPELLRRVMDEAQLLVRAEVLVMRAELEQELARTKVAAALAGAGVVLALSGLAVLFVALAAALPLTPWLGALLVGAGLLLLAGGLAYLAYRRAPIRPMARSQARLKQDLALTRETFH